MSDEKAADSPPEPVTSPPPAPAPALPPASAEPSFDPAARIRALDKDALDREVEAAMAGLSEKDLYGNLSRPEPVKTAARAEERRRKGKVMQVRGKDVFIDVPGDRSGGVLPLAQFPEGTPAVGTEIEFQIEGYDPEHGLLRLTRQGAAVQANWSSVAEGMTVEARVSGVNKGGLSVEVNAIRGFMPISQIDLYRVENAEQFINQKLLCLVTEVNVEQRNLVVSRRALLEREREESRVKLWQELAEGQVRPGIVRSIKEFGAFVDLGGVDGLLHISEMSWTRVADAQSVVQPGQPVKVIVLKIDREKQKVSLGLKQLQASPWDTVTSRYHAGSLVTGKVTRLTDFGAFVELEAGVEGLIHISELAPQRVRRVGDVVQIGQEVQVKILNVDMNQKRISLSLKAAAAPVEAESNEPTDEAVPEEARPQRPRTTPLRGGIGSE